MKRSKFNRAKKEISPPPKEKVTTRTKRTGIVTKNLSDLINCHCCKVVDSAHNMITCCRIECRESFCYNCVKKTYVKFNDNFLIILKEKESADRCYKCNNKCPCKICQKKEIKIEPPKLLNRKRINQRRRIISKPKQIEETKPIIEKKTEIENKKIISEDESTPDKDKTINQSINNINKSVHNTPPAVNNIWNNKSPNVSGKSWKFIQKKANRVAINKFKLQETNEGKKEKVVLGEFFIYEYNSSEEDAKKKPEEVKRHPFPLAFPLIKQNNQNVPFKLNKVYPSTRGEFKKENKAIKEEGMIIDRPSSMDDEGPNGRNDSSDLRSVSETKLNYEGRGSNGSEEKERLANFNNLHNLPNLSNFSDKQINSPSLIKNDELSNLQNGQSYNLYSIQSHEQQIPEFIKNGQEDILEIKEENKTNSNKPSYMDNYYVKTDRFSYFDNTFVPSENSNLTPIDVLDKKEETTPVLPLIKTKKPLTKPCNVCGNAHMEKSQVLKFATFLNFVDTLEKYIDRQILAQESNNKEKTVEDIQTYDLLSKNKEEVKLIREKFASGAIKQDNNFKRTKRICRKCLFSKIEEEKGVCVLLDSIVEEDENAELDVHKKEEILRNINTFMYPLKQLDSNEEINPSNPETETRIFNIFDNIFCKKKFPDDEMKNYSLLSDDYTSPHKNEEEKKTNFVSSILHGLNSNLNLNFLNDTIKKSNASNILHNMNDQSQPYINKKLVQTKEQQIDELYYLFNQSSAQYNNLQSLSMYNKLIMNISFYLVEQYISQYSQIITQREDCTKIIKDCLEKIYAEKKVICNGAEPVQDEGNLSSLDNIKNEFPLNKLEEVNLQSSNLINVLQSILGDMKNQCTSLCGDS